MCMQIPDVSAPLNVQGTAPGEQFPRALDIHRAVKPVKTYLMLMRSPAATFTAWSSSQDFL